MRTHWIILLLAITSLAIAPAACSTNPATGRSQLNVLSESEEVRIGEEAAPEFVKENGGELPSKPVLNYVRDIGKELAAVSERPDLPWEFHVLDSSVINAFALPGGKVFISRGLLERMNNEAQLAGVLGHEVGHVTAKHINDRMAQAIGWGVVGAAVGVAGQVTDEDWLSVLGVGVGVGGGLYQLSFSRDQEIESDKLGIRYMARLGYDPRGQVQVMQILHDASQQAGGGGIEFLSTHPLPQTRIDRLEQLINDQYRDQIRAGEFSFFAERFRQRALEPLSKLPPPTHGRQ